MLRPVRRDLPETFLENRFGVERRELAGFRFHTSGKGNSIWISSRRLPEAFDLEPDFAGMRCLRLKGKTKPTTCFLQSFGHLVERSDPELSVEEAEVFLKGGDFEAELECSAGYVAPRFRGDVLGCGLYRDGELRSKVPKGLRREVVLEQ